MGLHRIMGGSTGITTKGAYVCGGPRGGFITARIRRIGEGIVFSLSVHLHPSRLGGGRGTPSFLKGAPSSFLTGYPILLNRGYSHPGSERGVYPIPGQNVDVPPSQVRTGRGEGGIPPSKVRTRCPTGAAQRVLATQRALCLLRSRRRTFLFSCILLDKLVK